MKCKLEYGPNEAKPRTCPLHGIWVPCPDSLPRQHQPPVHYEPSACKQSEPWLCYPTVVSWLTGIRFDTLIALLGHDGSKIVNDEYDAPYNREGFSSSEMCLALLRHHWACIPLCAAINHHGDKPSSAYPEFRELQGELADNHDLIVVVADKNNGNGSHCYAWVPSVELIVDPLAGIAVSEIPYPIQYFEILERIK